jgi:hypothetical protein
MTNLIPLPFLLPQMQICCSELWQRSFYPMRKAKRIAGKPVIMLLNHLINSISLQMSYHERENKFLIIRPHFGQGAH